MILNKRSCIAILYILIGFTNCKKADTNPENANASEWTELGGENKSSFDSQIYNVLADNTGNIYVSGGVIQEIEVWNGSGWKHLGNLKSSPFTGGVYWPITLDNAGNVYAVGRIRVPQANSEYHVAKWDKASDTWINLTSSGILFDNGIHSIVADSLGNVYVAGNVLYLNSVEDGNYVYKWNGNSWKMLGNKLISGGNIFLHINNKGILYGSVGFNENMSVYIAEWDGANWSELGGKNSCNFGTGYVKCLNSDSKGNIYVGGYFTDGTKAYNIYKWTKTTNSWISMYTFGSSLETNSLVFDNTDAIYVAGNFADSSNARYIAKYLGRNWSNFGNLNANNTIQSICFDKEGNLYAGGDFINKTGKYYVAVKKKIKLAE